MNKKLSDLLEQLSEKMPEDELVQEIMEVADLSDDELGMDDMEDMGDLEGMEEEAPSLSLEDMLSEDMEEDEEELDLPSKRSEY